MPMSSVDRVSIPCTEAEAAPGLCLDLGPFAACHSPSLILFEKENIKNKKNDRLTLGFFCYDISIEQGSIMSLPHQTAL